MRQLLTRASLLLSLLVTVLICNPSAGSAQNMKIAYIDASKLLKRMPETVVAEAQLDQFVQGWNQDAEAMQNDLTRKRGDFERRKLIMTDAERSAAEVDIQNLQRKLNDFKQEKYGTNGELFTQQQTLMKPMYDKLLKAINEVAGENNYDYVFDRSSKDVSMLYSNSKYDITIPVARKLGIETDITQQPLLNNNPRGNQPGSTPPGAQQPDLRGRPGTAPQPQMPAPKR